MVNVTYKWSYPNKVIQRSLDFGHSKPKSKPQEHSQKIIAGQTELMQNLSVHYIKCKSRKKKIKHTRQIAGK